MVWGTFDISKIAWDGFFKTFIQVAEESKDAIIDIAAPLLENVVPIVVTFGVQTFMDTLSMFGKQLGDSIKEFEDNSGQQMLNAAADALEDLFGTSIDVSSAGIRRGETDRRKTSLKLGQVILDGMFANIGTQGEVTPEKGLANAEAVIGFAIGTSLEAWLSGILTHPFLQKFVPNWGDLDDILAANMGFGAITARSLSPLYEATVVTPFKWHINELYRPQIHSAKETAKLWNMGVIDEAQYFENLARLGWNREKSANYKLLGGRFPFKEDIARMQRLGMYTRDQAIQALRERNFIPDQADLLAEMYDRLGEDRANQRTKTVAADMFRDLEITESEFRGILTSTAAPQEECDAMVALGLLERSRPRSVPRSVMEKAFREDLIGLEELRGYYSQQGYGPDGVLMLEKLAVFDKELSAEKQIEREEKALAQELRAQELEEARARAPRSTMEQNYIRGLINASALEGYYGDEEFDREAITALMKLAKDRKQDFDEREAKKKATN